MAPAPDGQMLQQQGADPPAMTRVVDEHREFGRTPAGQHLVRADADHTAAFHRHQRRMIGIRGSDQPCDLAGDRMVSGGQEPAVQRVVAGPLVQIGQRDGVVGPRPVGCG